MILCKKEKKKTHTVSVGLALLKSARLIFKGSGELDIRWVKTEHGYGLRKQSSSINPTVTNQSFVLQQNFQQATDWFHRHDETQRGPSSKCLSSPVPSTIWHCFCENDSVMSPIETTGKTVFVHSSLTNSCFQFSKWGFSGRDLWQLDLLQIRHADHHPPAHNILGAESFWSHFLHSQSSWGMKHQVKSERNKNNI